MWLRRWQWWHLPALWAAAALGAAACVAADAWRSPGRFYYLLPVGHGLRGSAAIGAAMVRQHPLASAGVLGVPAAALGATILLAAAGMRRRRAGGPEA